MSKIGLDILEGFRLAELCAYGEKSIYSVNDGALIQKMKLSTRKRKLTALFRKMKIKVNFINGKET